MTYQVANRLKGYVGVAGVQTSKLTSADLITAAVELYQVPRGEIAAMVDDIEALGRERRAQLCVANRHLLPPAWLSNKPAPHRRIKTPSAAATPPQRLDAAFVQQGWLVVDANGKVLGGYLTNGEAWKAADRLNREPTSKAEAFVDFINQSRGTQR